MARLNQLLLSLVFLTRLPLGGLLPARVMPLAQAAWSFPLVGILIGAMGALPMLIEGPPLLAGCLSVAVTVWFTGALHEDAMADFADAAGGRDRAARLRIMRDSGLGSYGAMALILTTALRISALMAVPPVALIAAATGGRTAIVLAMRLMPPARRDGLGHAAGRPGLGSCSFAFGLCLVLMLLTPSSGWAVAGGALVGLLIAARAMRWLGGQTGDVLGAISLGVETAMLVCFALALA